MRAAGGAAAGVGQGLEADQAGVSAYWTGTAATSFQTSVVLVATGSREGGQALRDTAIVLEDYAGRLEQAQQQAALLNAQMAEADADKLASLAGSDHQATLTGLRGQHEGIVAELQQAAYQARARLEAIASRAGRVAGKSIEDIIGDTTAAALTELPVLQEHPEFTRAAVWAYMTTPGLVGAGFGVWKSRKWFSHLVDLRAAQDLPTNFRALFGPGPRPPAPTWANSSKLNFVVNRLSEADAARARAVLNHPVSAGTTPSESLLKGSLRTLPQRAGLARGMGVVGGVAATGASLANVLAQGNPGDAWEQNGMDYVADIAEVGFNASLTAFMVAPNPWTAGATAVTGAVYGATEIIAHKEEILTLAETAGSAIWDVQAEGFKRAGEFANDLVGEGLGKGIGKATDALNPFN